MLLCPSCQRSFEAAGFCPYDGTPLVAKAGADQQTLLSVAMPAVAPISTGSMAVAQQPTVQPEAKPRTLPLPSPQNAMKSVSASRGATAALQSLKAQQNEYDKLVGETLDGRYFILRKIGEGGMGVVFAARHAVIERPLAIKVLKREATRDVAMVQRFVQEAKAASRIGHPNIVDVTDFGTTPDGMTFSVMELVDAPTLGATIREAAPFPKERALKITAQLARALGAAHDKGIVHRDLKPENVFLLDRDGRTDFVKIVDFGIAKVTPLQGAANEPRLTRVGAVFGTPEYMAPEQAAGRSDPDGRVDIYALGVILYEMLTGRVPHRGDTVVRTIAMQMLDDAIPPSKVRPDLDIPPALEAIVMKALAKRREDRYQTMGELLAAIDALQTPVGLSVTGSPVYALTPLPPGADAVDPKSPTVVLPDANTPAHGIPYQRPISVVESTPRRARTPTNRVKHEPEFVASDRPQTFEHVFTDEPPPPARKRWPLLVLLAIVLGGIAGAIVLFAKRRAMEPAPVDAIVAVIEPDAAVVVVPPPPADATELVEPPADAAVVVRPPRDSAIVLKPLPRDAGAIDPRFGSGDPTRMVRVQVITQPDRARIYQGTTYRGEGGVTLEEPYGTRMELECRSTVGYKPGKVAIVFDGKTDVYACQLTRIKLCIDNVKNPFDDCELDPTKPIPQQPDPK